MLALVIGIAGFLAAGAHLPAHAGENANSPAHHAIEPSPANVGTDSMEVADMVGHEMPAHPDAAKDPRAAHICFFCMTLEEPVGFSAPLARTFWPPTSAASFFHPTPLPFHPPRFS